MIMNWTEIGISRSLITAASSFNGFLPIINSTSQCFFMAQLTRIPWVELGPA